MVKNFIKDDSMNIRPLRKLVLSGLFAAIIAAVTSFPVPIPIAHGYVNLGDCFVLLSGLFLGPAYAFGAAAIGSALADIFAGFAVYVPATFLIKGLMALIFSLIAGKIQSKHHTLRLCAAATVAEILMVLGYLVFELFLYGTGAIVSVPANAFQGLVCGISGVLLSCVLLKSKTIKNLL